MKNASQKFRVLYAPLRLAISTIYRSRNLAIFQTMLFMIIAFVFDSRSFFIGALTAACMWIYIMLPGRKQVTASGLVGIFIILTAMLSFFIKADSTQGRLLIYKISWTMFCQNWVTGIGINRFDREYLQYQARYFEQGAYTPKELLLADNTYFAFNDYWQWIVETGLSGLLLLSAASFMIICLIVYSARSGIQQFSTYTALNVIVTLLTAAIFTHVFERWWCQITLLLGLAPLVIRSTQETSRRRLPLMVLMVIGPFLLYACMDTLYRNYAFSKSAQAIELNLYGYHELALKSFARHYNLLKDDYRFIAAYAQACERSGKYIKALHLYQILSKQRISNYTYFKIAECCRRLKDPKTAHYYKKAIATVPNRLAIREALFCYYLLQKRYDEAYKTGVELLKIPVKIRSRRATAIRERTAVQLKQLRYLIPKNRLIQLINTFYLNQTL